jgi:hypothetical protein
LEGKLENLIPIDEKHEHEKNETLLTLLANELISIYPNKDELAKMFSTMLFKEYQKINKDVTEEEVSHLFTMYMYDTVRHKITIKAFKCYKEALNSFRS